MNKTTSYKKANFRHSLMFMLSAKSRRLLIIFLFASIGLILLLSTRAASSSINIEIGSGSVVTSPAVTVSDPNVSGGSYVRFYAKSGNGRTYPLHTNINATTFWVGERFQPTPDGSQVCSAYDSDWIWNFFRLSHANNCSIPSSGYISGCDALLSNQAGACDDINSIGSLRTPANGYFPPNIAQIYQNPFYLDLPYDDFNPTDSTDITGYSTRCQDIPWANDAGYVGHCTDRKFSYMKNRWVKIMANGQTCYGQIEDAGPADDGHGNPHYDDRLYVFGTNDARPINKSYNSAGMDVSPALNSCLRGTFNKDLMVNWQFVDDSDVPAGPWKTIITTTKPQ